jgi:hypothetical protein
MFGFKKKEVSIAGNVVNTAAKPHPEIVLNHVSGKPQIFINIEEELKSFECVVSILDAGTYTLDDLTSVFKIVAQDLGLQMIETSDITEAQYGKNIKTFVSGKPNSAILYSFVLNGKKMIGYWLRSQYLYTLE